MLPITIVTMCIAGLIVFYKLYVMRITKIVVNDNKFYHQLEEDDSTAGKVELESNPSSV